MRHSKSSLHSCDQFGYPRVPSLRTKHSKQVDFQLKSGWSLILKCLFTWYVVDWFGASFCVTIVSKVSEGTAEGSKHRALVRTSTTDATAKRCARFQALCMVSHNPHMFKFRVFLTLWFPWKFDISAYLHSVKLHGNFLSSWQDGSHCHPPQGEAMFSLFWSGWDAAGFTPESLCS